MPEWYLDEPIDYPGDEFYLTAFHQLGTCRQYGDIPGPIPWDKIVTYADRRGLDNVIGVAFEHIISAMDNRYLKWYHQKQKVISKSKGK